MKSNDNEVLGNIISIVKTATRNNDITADSTQENTQGWDSLAYMSILSEIEAVYDVAISQDNIQEFNSIHSIAEIIDKNNTV